MLGQAIHAEVPYGRHSATKLPKGMGVRGRLLVTAAGYGAAALAVGT